MVSRGVFSNCVVGSNSKFDSMVPMVPITSDSIYTYFYLIPHTELRFLSTMSTIAWIRRGSCDFGTRMVLTFEVMVLRYPASLLFDGDSFPI